VALSVALTGTGSVGDIVDGWSVGEFATPATIGASAAGTGTVSFSARATADSLTVINNNAVSTVNNLGTVEGVIQSVSQTGATVSVTHNTVLENYNMDVSVAPVVSGGAKGWFYQLLQDMNKQERVGFLPDVATFGYSFPFDSSPLDMTSQVNIDNVFIDTPFADVTRLHVDGDIQGFVYETAGTPLADWYDTVTIDDTPLLPYSFGEEAFVTQFTSMVDTDTNMFFGFVLTAEPAFAVGNENCISVEIDGATDSVYIRNYDALGVNTTTTLDISGLDHTQPLMFVLRSDYDATTFTSTTAVTVVDVDNINVQGNNSCGGGYLYNPLYFHLNTPFMGAVNIFRMQTASATPVDWFDTSIGGAYADIDFTGYTQVYNGAYPATEGVAWELIQQLGAAEKFDVHVSGNTMVVTDIGVRTLDITNVAGFPTVSPSTAFSGSAVNVEYSSPAYVFGLLYDAATDNRTISAGVGEVTTISVKSNINPLTLTQPVATSSYPVGDGEYYVVDSSGIVVPPSVWENFGGKLFAEVDPEDNTAIKLTLTGPKSEATNAGGPYKVGTFNDYGAMRLTGTGVYDGEDVVAVGTGVDPAKFTRTTVTSVTNPFIRNVEHAYDRGVWAAVKAGGPNVSFSATIPVSSVAGVGLTCGSLFDYANCTYRVSSASLGAIGAGISAEWYVTVADVDAIWGSQTVGDYDGFWGAYECQDQIIYPYLGA